jgi:hypothetical protein
LSSNPPWSKSVVWREHERVFNSLGDVKEFWKYNGKKKGFLVITNLRLIFLTSLDNLSNVFAEDYSIDLEKIISVSPEKDGSDWRFKIGGFNQALVILIPNRQHFDFAKEGIHDIIPQLEVLISERKEAVPASARTETKTIPHESATASAQHTLKEKEIHVVVKIPCRFCGTLNDQFSPKCLSCGAPIR